jgi:hypothetical protein
MKRSHSIIISVSAAVLAAILVIGGYALMRDKPARMHKERKTPIVHKEGVQAKKNAANAKKNMPPPPGMPTSPPPIPDMVREGKLPPAPPATLPSGEDLREQFLLLQKFLELPQDRLVRIRESIERIERMPPERRKMMLERLKGTGNTSQLKEPAKSGVDVRDAPEDVRLQVAAIVETMSDSERTVLVGKLKNYSSEQRAVYFEGMAIGAASVKETAIKAGSAPWKASEKNSSGK